MPHGKARNGYAVTHFMARVEKTKQKPEVLLGQEVPHIALENPKGGEAQVNGYRADKG